MNNKLKYVLVAVLAVIVGIGCYAVLHSSTVKVCVYAGDYEEGTELKEDMFTSVEMSASLVKNYAKQSDNQGTYITPDTLNQILSMTELPENPTDEEVALYNNRYLACQVKAGTPVISSQFGAYAGTNEGLDLLDPENNVATTFSADSVVGISGTLKKGSYINIYASWESLENGNGEGAKSEYVVDDMASARTAVLLKNVRVVNIQSEDVDDEGNSVGVSAITVETNAQDAVKLADAAVNAKLYCSLLNHQKFNDDTELYDVLQHGYAKSKDATYELQGSEKSAADDDQAAQDDAAQTDDQAYTAEQ